ncbi:RDD family protein [Nonomuraea sp. NPDC049637]|uniref:RDD family protein n=1 Tax=Nonomuraea sp. NPDC049637 TaxID=3154356 RepID=UPI00342D06DB
MSRSALLVWAAALTAAAYPTWIAWQPKDLASQLYFCMGGVGDLGGISPFLPLRGDLGTLTALMTTWGIPVLVVLAALGHWRSAAAGRRAAGLLVLTAIAIPLTPWYAGDGPCGEELELFGLDWFQAVIGSWGRVENALLISAALVLLATHALGPAQEPAVTPIWRAGLLFLIDYLVVACVVTLAVVLTDGWATGTSGGLLNWLSFEAILDEPARLLFWPALVGYVLLRRRLAARPAVVAGLPRRSALPPWVWLVRTAAVAAAAFPTWQSWGTVPAEWAHRTSGSGTLRTVLETLRGDAGRVVEFAVGWGVPVIAVVACIGLVLMLLAARWMPPDDRPARTRSSRRVTALLIDYLVVITILLALPRLGATYAPDLDHGLLDSIWREPIFQDDGRLIVLPVVFLYALSGHTLGKLVMRLRIVAAGAGRRPAWRRLAVRALVFPLPAFVPQAGIALLALDGLSALTDPAGRGLHDRLAGTLVVDRPGSRRSR